MTKLEHLSDLLYASFACISLLQKHAATHEEQELCQYLLSNDGLPAGYINIDTLQRLLRNRNRVKNPVYGLN
jgi:hypothetical protein